MPDLITVDEVAELLRLSRAQLYRRMKDPAMPRAVRVSPRRQLFRRKDIEAFLDAGGIEQRGE